MCVTIKENSYAKKRRNMLTIFAYITPEMGTNKNHSGRVENIIESV